MLELLLRCAAVALVASVAGCQCCGLTERYNDVVDHVADCEPNLCGLYHPCLDLTRIGKPDWRQCRFNCLWCRRACCDVPVEYSGNHWCPYCAEDFPPYDGAAANDSATPPPVEPSETPDVPPLPKADDEPHDLPGKSPYATPPKAADESTGGGAPLLFPVN